MNAEQYAKYLKDSEDKMLNAPHMFGGYKKCHYTYFWIDGDGNMRNKVKIMVTDTPRSPPDWNYDGSSTGQAPGVDSEVILKPRGVYPFMSSSNSSNTRSHERHFIVLCDTWHRSKHINADGKICYSDLIPALNNNRSMADDIFSIPDVSNQRFWFGLEQEYFLKLLGTTREEHSRGVHEDYHDYPGTFYCGVGAKSVYMRECKLVDAHREACIAAGINISGTNAEVAPSQWEFQIGPCEGIDAADQLWVARYLLVRLAAEEGYEVIFDPKLFTETAADDVGCVNGSGCHTNFSTKLMRTCPTKTRTVTREVTQTQLRLVPELVEKDPSAIERRANGVSDYIMKTIECLENVHEQHMMVYGKGNEERMTGECETASFDKFTYGVGDRGVSIRIPVDVFLNGYGYIEDRRPAANADPYLVTSFIARTVAPAATNVNINVDNSKVSITGTEMTPKEFNEWEAGVFAQAAKTDSHYHDRLTKMVEDAANKRAAGAESEDSRQAMDERFARAHRQCDEDYEIEKSMKRDHIAQRQMRASGSRSLSPTRSFAMPTENGLDAISSDNEFDETKGEGLWEHYNTVVKNGRRLYLDEGRPEQPGSYYEL